MYPPPGDWDFIYTGIAYKLNTVVELKTHYFQKVFTVRLIRHQSNRIVICNALTFSEHATTWRGIIRGYKTQHAFHCVQSLSTTFTVKNIIKYMVCTPGRQLSIVYVFPIIRQKMRGVINGFTTFFLYSIEGIFWIKYGKAIFSLILRDTLKNRIKISLVRLSWSLSRDRTVV